MHISFLAFSSKPKEWVIGDKCDDDEEDKLACMKWSEIEGDKFARDWRSIESQR